MSKKQKVYIWLWIAEKPSVAKGVADIMSKGKNRKIQGLSKYNPVFEFEYKYGATSILIRFTSVLGHVMSYKYPDAYRSWTDTEYSDMYRVKLEKVVIPTSENVVKSIQSLVKDADSVILWLDWDREGEAIAADIQDIWRKEKENLQILRAHFSAVSKVEIEKAMKHLTKVNDRLADWVNARQEIDLKLGASFTRFQTINFKNILGVDDGKVISYGPCQFPTLWFVYDRWRTRNQFKSEKYWFLTWKYEVPGSEDEKKYLNFDWKKGKLFDKLIWLIIYEGVVEKLNADEAIVSKVARKTRKRRKPQPLNTIELQKQLSRKLHISSAKTMEIWEKLYNKGYLSYPRTETNKFTNIDLKKLVKEHVLSKDWGDYASKILEGDLWEEPRNGKSDDGAHPPIHPIKLAKR